MKTLSGGNFEGKEKRVDFGDAVISNAKYDCSKCLLKKLGCKHNVNTLNCEIAIHRMRKTIDEYNSEDTELKKEQDSAIKDFLKNVQSQEDIDEED